MYRIRGNPHLSLFTIALKLGGSFGVLAGVGYWGGKRVPCVGKPVYISTSFNAPINAVNDSIMPRTWSANAPLTSAPFSGESCGSGVGTEVGFINESRSEKVASAAGAD